MTNSLYRKSFKMFELIVGNIGSVYCGSSEKEAKEKFNTYKNHSINNYGRAVGENVTLMEEKTYQGGFEIVEEFIGSIEQSEINKDKEIDRLANGNPYE